MSRLYKVHRTINDLISNAGLASELILAESESKAILLRKSRPDLLANIDTTAKKQGIFAKTLPLDSGVLVMISSRPISEDRLRTVGADTERQYGKLYAQLTEALQDPKSEYDEAVAQRADRWVPACRGTEQPITARGRRLLYCFNPKTGKHAYIDLNTDMPISDEEAFKILGESKRPAQVKPNKDLYSKIDEAFDGIAIQDGATQPQEGLKTLKQVLNEPTKAGVTLAQALKKSGVEMHVAQPGKHVVTFLRGKQEVWRVETTLLSDKKELEQTLSALWSIAAGKAPNARQMELDAIKNRAQQAREAESELSTIAQKFIPEPDQPVKQEVRR